MEQLFVSSTALAKIFLLTSISFLIAMIVAPFFTNFMYRNRLGKKIRDTSLDNQKAPIFFALHKNKENTPTMGGLIIWLTTALVTITLNLKRAETLLPLAALIGSGIIGAVDDIYNLKGIGPHRGGMKFGLKFLLYTGVAAIGAWWFFAKLGWSIIHIPGVGNFEIGWWYIPLFIIVLVGTAFAANQTDGLDGLAGGVFMISFGAYCIIALTQGKVALAAFCGILMGALLAFLWFNIYPARFFMGDTGSMALGMTLGVLAFLTNTVFVLPIIGFILVIEAGSTVIQIGSKKLRQGKKVFLSAPIHHHFEAKGWPEAKVTMRFWVISGVMAVIGLVVALIGRG